MSDVTAGQIGPGAPRKQRNVARATLMDICRKSIFENRLVFICVTSAAEGAVESEGLGYGQGKSTFAMGLATILFMEAYGVDFETAEKLVKSNMGYDETAVLDMVTRGRSKRVPVWISDDMEVAFGKHRSHDNQCREIAYFMQTIRPYAGVFIGTMPDLGQIARCWRDLFMFEVKVPFRGYCEIQQIKRWSDFYDPLDPNISLAYAGEQSFPKVSAEMQAWYDVWRDEKVRREQDRIIKKYHPADDVKLSPDVRTELEKRRSAAAAELKNLSVQINRDKKRQIP